MLMMSFEVEVEKKEKKQVEKKEAKSKPIFPLTSSVILDPTKTTRDRRR